MPERKRPLRGKISNVHDQYKQRITLTACNNPTNRCTEGHKKKG